MIYFFRKCQNPHPMPDPPPHGLDIDRCITVIFERDAKENRAKKKVSRAHLFLAFFRVTHDRLRQIKTIRSLHFTQIFMAEILSTLFAKRAGFCLTLKTGDMKIAQNLCSRIDSLTTKQTDAESFKFVSSMIFSSLYHY